MDSRVRNSSSMALPSIGAVYPLAIGELFLFLFLFLGGFEFVLLDFMLISDSILEARSADPASVSPSEFIFYIFRQYIV
jgi:hypothetical protein